jgi:hypothetical protein
METYTETGMYVCMYVCMYMISAPKLHEKGGIHSTENKAAGKGIQREKDEADDGKKNPS